jgi:uncharacterized membrane protein YjjP (DUF1212 family)
MDEIDPVLLRHRSLEQIAMTSLRAGRMLMESGARADVVQRGAVMVARGLGAEQVSFRVGYASLAITVGSGLNTITRMIGVGAHGVNLRLNHGLRGLCARLGQGGQTPGEATAALSMLATDTPRHDWGVVALAVGLACAAFGRLLGIDWIAFGPVLAAGAIGQGVRHWLLKGGVNGFVVAALTAFAAAILAGLSARHLGSQTVELAMTAAVLLLVPGVPLLNAQTDIMEGHPTLGSARAVSVGMVLVFVTLGVWLAQTVLGVGPSNTGTAFHGVAHQTLFGAIAAAGFGVLFNFGAPTLVWSAVAGAVALLVRTLGLEAGWSLEAASFAAAVAVGMGVQALDCLPGHHINRAGNALALAGCIPMVPGGSAAQGILGLLGLTAPGLTEGGPLLLLTAICVLRVVFTIGAIGAGLTLATCLWRRPDFPA